MEGYARKGQVTVVMKKVRLDAVSVESWEVVRCTLFVRH
jgi:hypothetical protein